MIVTESAIKKVAELIEGTRIAIPNETIFLRITVMPGGCSGLRYQTYFDYETRDTDDVYTFDNFDLRIDNLSKPYLDGATLDFVDTIEKQGFTIDNPNSHGTCSCGDSFH